MKTLFEIFRILRELGVKTKDIIGVGKNIKQVGQTLFNADVNTRVLRLIHRTGEIGDSLKSELVNVGRTLRNLNDIEKRKFLTNLKQIKNVFKPQEAEVIDIATKAKLPASGIEKLKSTVGFPRNVHPESDIGRIMTHARKSKTFDTTKRAMQLGEARWILDKAVKDDLFAFKPQEIEIIKGGKGDVLEIFKEYFGNKAANNLPGDGSISAASRYFKKLNAAVDESGFLKNHPEFNKETIDFKKTEEMLKKYGNRLDDHPLHTESELAKVFDQPKGTFPRLDPDNDSFIILDEIGTKVGRYEGQVSADEVTGRTIYKWWDKWDVKNNKVFTDKSKYKFSGAMDDKGNDIITAEGVIKGGKDPEFASGGRIGYEDGEMVLPQPKPEEVYLDQEIKRIQRAREMILKYKNAFTDKGEALLDMLDQEQALWRKKVLEHENIPGHATGGVSNLFRKR